MYIYIHIYRVILNDLDELRYQLTPEEGRVLQIFINCDELVTEKEPKVSAIVADMLKCLTEAFCILREFGRKYWLGSSSHRFHSSWDNSTAPYSRENHICHTFAGYIPSHLGKLERPHCDITVNHWVIREIILEWP